MDTQLISRPHDPPLLPSETALVPTLFTGAGEQASYRFIEYFTARTRNPNTRQTYFRPSTASANGVRCATWT
jgi:hypothetical protein